TPVRSGSPERNSHRHPAQLTQMRTQRAGKVENLHRLREPVGLHLELDPNLLSERAVRAGVLMDHLSGPQELEVPSGTSLTGQLLQRLITDTRLTRVAHAWPPRRSTKSSSEMTTRDLETFLLCDFRTSAGIGGSNIERRSA